MLYTLNGDTTSVARLATAASTRILPQRANYCDAGDQRHADERSALLRLVVRLARLVGVEGI